jgi:hypothetical protein
MKTHFMTYIEYVKFNLICLVAVIAVLNISFQSLPHISNLVHLTIYSINVKVCMSVCIFGHAWELQISSVSIQMCHGALNDTERDMRWLNPLFIYQSWNLPIIGICSVVIALCNSVKSCETILQHCGLYIAGACMCDYVYMWGSGGQGVMYPCVCDR